MELTNHLPGVPIEYINSPQLVHRVPWELRVWVATCYNEVVARMPRRLVTEQSDGELERGRVNADTHQGTSSVSSSLSIPLTASETRASSAECSARAAAV